MLEISKGMAACALISAVTRTVREACPFIYIGFQPLNLIAANRHAGYCIEPLLQKAL